MACAALETAKDATTPMDDACDVPSTSRHFNDGRRISFDLDVKEYVFVESQDLKMSTDRADRIRFFNQMCEKHDHVRIVEPDLSLVSRVKLPMYIERRLQQYIGKLRTFDKFYQYHNAAFSELNARIRRVDSGHYRINRAVLKLTEICMRSEYYGQPVYELGCPPARFLESYEKNHKVRVFGGGLFSRLRRDLTSVQLDHFAKVIKKPGIDILDQDALCSICLDRTLKIVREECVKIVISDMGFNIDYSSPPLNWFAYALYLLKLFAKTDVDVIIKIQQFGKTIEHYRTFPRFLKAVKMLGYSIHFTKPRGSWLGNDEVYIYTTKDATPFVDYHSLSKVLDKMLTNRKKIINMFSDSLE